MSNVLQKDRKESGLEFLYLPHQLEVFTAVNSKRIPKTHTFDLRVPLSESARKINECVVKANNIYPNSIKDEQYKANSIRKRIELQKYALMECDNFIEILTVTQEVVPISDGILEEWVRIILATKNAIRKWHEKDKERYLY